MRGLPLSGQLQALGGGFACETVTAPEYRLFALAGSGVARPGLVRMSGGAAIAVEVWDMPAERVGDLLATIPSPLGLGPVRLADGSSAIGFLCEAAAAGGARDITAFGGWRAFLAAGDGGPAVQAQV
jgi:allophanate hydrolase